MAEHAESASYRASGFSNRLGWGERPALLLIDMCAAYFTPGSPLDTSSNPAAAAVPQVIRKLLDAARESNIPVIWTQVRYTSPNLEDAGLFYKKASVVGMFHPSSPLHPQYATYLPTLTPLPSEHEILKTHPSAFFGTSLASLLRYLQVDTVVVGGVSTSGCVRATVLDAICLNFRPMVVEAACGDRAEAIHKANVFDMDAKMADVVGVEEAVGEIRKAGGRA